MLLQQYMDGRMHEAQIEPRMRFRSRYKSAKEMKTANVEHGIEHTEIKLGSHNSTSKIETFNQLNLA